MKEFKLLMVLLMVTVFGLSSFSFMNTGKMASANTKQESDGEIVDEVDHARIAFHRKQNRN